MPLDTSTIVPHLVQGAAPPPGSAVARAGFKVLVLCADEYQPPASAFPGVRVIHAPNDDAARQPTVRELRIAHDAAREVAHAVRSRTATLVTCMAGRNRSGLVSALALRYLTGEAGCPCACVVQERRPDALSNTHFFDYLARLPPLR